MSSKARYLSKEEYKRFERLIADIKSGRLLNPEGLLYLAELVDNEIRVWLDTAHKDAKSILTKGKAVVDKLAKALLDKETLSGEEIREIVLGKKAVAKKKTTKPAKKSNAKK